MKLEKPKSIIINIIPQKIVAIGRQKSKTVIGEETSNGILCGPVGVSRPKGIIDL